MDGFWMKFGSMIAIAAAGLAAMSASAQTAPEIREERVILLAEAFPDLDAAGAYTFRARKVELAPGARTDTMQHAGRPSITYVTGGSVHEIREGTSAPTEHKTGAAILARANVTHAWENISTLPATLLIVEVIPKP